MKGPDSSDAQGFRSNTKDREAWLECARQVFDLIWLDLAEAAMAPRIQMASKKKNTAKAKPSKLQSLKKMILGSSSSGKATAAKASKGAGKKASKGAAIPAKAASAKGTASGKKAAAATGMSKTPAKKTTAKKAAAVDKAAPGKADATPKNLLNGRASKSTEGTKSAPKRESMRAGVRMYMETGTLLLGNPDGACREMACENQSTTAGYCRAHYIKNWKKIKHKEQILREGRLNQYLDELIAKYPDKYIEAIKQDLASEKDFAKVITDLDLDESTDDFDVDQESMDNIIDTIKRDFEDEGEAF